MEKLDFLFAKDIDLRSLNDENVALHVDFQDNLIVTGLILFSVTGKIGKKIQVIRAFVGGSRMKNEIAKGRMPNAIEKKHTKGLALQITWEDFNTNTALEIAEKIYNANDTNDICFIISDTDMIMTRKNKDKQIVRVLYNKKEKIIYRSGA